MTAKVAQESGLGLPTGVQLRALQPHDDDRGRFTELFRDQWDLGDRPVQWNVVHSAPNVLRGVHLHRFHADCLTVASGEMRLALKDVRPDSSTRGIGCILAMSGDQPALAYIPPGVAHGFYFPVASLHIYGVSRAFDGSDEYGCRWDDTALGFDWPCKDPVLSPRDRSAGSFADMLAAAGLSLPAV